MEKKNKFEKRENEKFQKVVKYAKRPAQALGIAGLGYAVKKLGPKVLKKGVEFATKVITK